MQTKKQIGTKTIIKEFKPNLFKVILLNDEITTMDFVVMVLIDIFNKSQDEAIRIMLNIHKTGSGICGVYTKEIAQTKQMEVLNLARANGFPLKCVIKEE